MVRGSKLIPGRAQNVFEWFYEFLSDFGLGIAGPTARPYIPLFAAFFLLILFCNWSGLVPPIGRVDELRAPTSDVNITLGLALVSFVYFEFQGFKRLGFRGYRGQVLPALRVQERDRGGRHRACSSGSSSSCSNSSSRSRSRCDSSATSMAARSRSASSPRLTIAFIPVGLLGLEVMLNAIQALIFSILTLMFIVLAIESHEHEEGQVAEEALDAVHGQEKPALQPAH